MARVQGRQKPATTRAMVHPSAVVDRGAKLGAGVKVWHFCHVMKGAVLGRGVMLGQGCFVGAGVQIGARARLQNHVSVFEGVLLSEDVFVGPGVVFTNVRLPRAFVARRELTPGEAGGFEQTRVGRGASIGANATIVCGAELGDYCLVGAGAVVTRDVPSFALVMGVPARRVGWVSRRGERLRFKNGVARCPTGGERYVLAGGSVRLEEAPAAPGARRRARSSR
jgi:UDP-2-acetamido-3-amino-2,3-dideoxy-glucuronate N-acetyltransferase